VKPRLLAVVPLGDCGAYVEFSRTLDLEINAFVQRLGAALEADTPPLLRDIVPAFGGLALHFAPEFDGDVLEAARELVERRLKAGVPAAKGAGRLVEVPVCYEPQFALDLKEVSESRNISGEELAALHCAREYRVLMVGFAPGHGYLWGLDPKIAVPRRANPRAEVPAGSVAIANEQTVVYPYAISGGWSVIGRTPLRIFDAARAEPSLFLAGDRVRFHAIDAAEFRRQSEAPA